MKDSQPNNLCFKARWISPATGKRVTALHFGSFVDAMRKTHSRPLFREYVRRV